MTKKTLYHVTPWERLPLIIAAGIVHQKTPQQTGGLGQDVRTVKNAVFAFDNAEDAASWAFKWTWDGKARFAIIRFTSNARWVRDKHLEAQSARGRWLACKKPVPSEQIEAIVSYDPDKMSPGEDRNLNYESGPLRDWFKEGRENGK